MGAVEPGTEIFIVDDDASVREVLVDLFSIEGYRTRALRSGEQAWHAINCGARPAGIVLDLWLPGMSGGEFIERLRASGNSAIPIVVLSGAGWSERMECEADAAFRKPVEASELVRAVDRLVVRAAGSRMMGRPVRKTARSAGAGSGHRAT